MRGRFRVTALILAALACLAYAFFMAAKHLPAVSAVNPFGDDPFDAVGSFGVQAGVFLALLSLIRAFRMSPARGDIGKEQVLVGRTQILAVLAAAVTLAADAVAMARYPSLWTRSPAGFALGATLVVMFLITIAVGVIAYRPVSALRLQPIGGSWVRAAVVLLAFVAILAAYPDSVRQSTPGALLTVVVGAILLFAPMWAWATSLVPYQSEALEQDPIGIPSWLRRTKYGVGLVICVGVVLGIIFVVAESTEGGGILPSRFVLVASVYVGLETAGILIGYAFLRKPLGLVLHDAPS